MQAFKKEYNEYFKEIEGELPKKLNSISVIAGEKPYSIRFRGDDVEKKEDIIEDLEYVPVQLEDADVEYIYVLLTRQGGGNRECYCENEHEDCCLASNNEKLENNPNYIYDEDDMFDSTYATFYFKADKKLTEKYFKQEEKLNRINEKIRLKKGIERGLKPPWSIRKEFDQKLYDKYFDKKF